MTPRPMPPTLPSTDASHSGADTEIQPPARIRTPRDRSTSSAGFHSLGASHGGMRPGPAMVLLGSALRVQTDRALL